MRTSRTVVLDPRYSVALRGLLMRPDGVQHGAWQQDLPALASAGTWCSQTRSPTPRREGDVERRMWSGWPRHRPGHRGIPSAQQRGARYEGEFHAGKKNGTGTLTWPNGNRYSGTWRDGRAHGTGKFTQANGAYYEGAWEDGCFRDGTRRAAVGRPFAEC
jgi:hypothetical protein